MGKENGVRNSQVNIFCYFLWVLRFEFYQILLDILIVKVNINIHTVIDNYIYNTSNHKG